MPTGFNITLHMVLEVILKGLFSSLSSNILWVLTNL
ncbi:MAG: hypothetical protein CM15mP83_1750 [Flavobacteriaceae bacterium]|nr:MAG: hypothetical protein CM15mP83_1750 [Flavobacteriaceae bacterium]